MKQETLAMELNINQQKMSLLEQKEVIDDDIMEQIAEIFKMPVDAIRNFDEEAAINFISNTFHGSFAGINYNPTLNPVDKWMDALKKNEDLYERLLISEKEKVQLLTKVLSEKN